jgi:hypothetical protein
MAEVNWMHTAQPPQVQWDNSSDPGNSSPLQLQQVNLEDDEDDISSSQEKKEAKKAYRHCSWRKVGRHILAFVYMFIFGVIPMLSFFSIDAEPWVPLAVTCATDSWRVASAARGPAIQGLFIIDRLIVNLPFWAAKLLDVAWDLCIGRGGQGLASYVSYVVFTKALMKSLEWAPTPHRTFEGVSIHGPTFWTTWLLVKDLPRHSSKKGKALFIFILISCLWILAFPTLLSAMTGYISASESFIPSINSTSMLPVKQLKDGYIIGNGDLIGIGDGGCTPEQDSVWKFNNFVRFRKSYCKCSPYLVPKTPFQTLFWH